MGFDPDHRVSCAQRGCYATINLSPKGYGRLKRTGERFFCPAGHSNYFAGKTDEQKEIDRLTRDLDHTERDLTRAENQRDTAIELVRRCPICLKTPGRHIQVHRNPWRYEDDLANVRDWMAEHVRTEHMAEVRAEVEA
jgi:hypothetical protein